MWRKRNQETDLRMLLTKIDSAPEPTTDLIEGILQHACPRLEVSVGPNDFLARLIEAEAWVELGLWLIGWELPEWASTSSRGGTTPGTARSASAGSRTTGSTTSPTFNTAVYPWRSSELLSKHSCGK
jgi:hypothetical protein